MVSLSPSKVAAIMAAVLRHASDEPEGAMPEAAERVPSAPAPVQSVWLSAGRQSSMFDRVVVQRRLSKSW
ncbi:MAG: hypothetical protein HY900_04655 [Deltaproteobacteria bacterium]|nr:hypothetical protein [Deltaproteobacteria bacterium]